MKNDVILLQARMRSTRLPGKVLMPVLGKPLLAYAVERLQQVADCDTLMVVTSDDAADTPIADWCRQNAVLCFRGSEQDVLDRYYQAACQANASRVIRVTGDCPLIDPDVLTTLINAYDAAAASGPVDYLSNTLERTFPRGLDGEIFSFSALETAWQEGKDPVEREHVTPYIYRHPERFQVEQYRQAVNHSSKRWTVDVPEDFQLIEKILTALVPLKPDFRQADVLALLAKNPDWSDINAHIEQKALTTGAA